MQLHVFRTASCTSLHDTVRIGAGVEQTRYTLPRQLAEAETVMIAGGVFCTYAPALVAIRLMTGVDFGNFVCDDGTTA